MKMEMIMVATALGLAVAIGNSVDAEEPASTTGARAAESATGAGEPAAALVDAIIRKMESSGALGAAGERAANRSVQPTGRAEGARRG